MLLGPGLCRTVRPQLRAHVFSWLLFHKCYSLSGVSEGYTVFWVLLETGQNQALQL